MKRHYEVTPTHVQVPKVLGVCLCVCLINPFTLTVSCHMGYRYKTKHPVPDRVKPSFVIFEIRAL